LSCAVGFKNGTDGGLTVATNALKSVFHSHSFLGINSEGEVSIIKTKGNQHAHVVLRGGGGKPNYDSVNIRRCEQALEKSGLKANIMVDCSHENSDKDPANQPLVANDIMHQIADGNKSIVGLMIESNIGFGNQKMPENPADLKYGVSITDGCIDWQQTEDCLLDMHNKLKDILPKR
jgi:3-deoxy-7-phosphoheptulonate synthase